MADPHAEDWARVLAAPDEHVRRLALRASREPILRALFPYLSLQQLRFSVATEYPYDALPYIHFDSFSGRYEVRDWDRRPVAGGELEDLVAVLRPLMEARLRERPA